MSVAAGGDDDVGVQQGLPSGATAPGAEQQRLETEKIAMLLTSYTELDARAKEALHGLSLQQVVKILSDYEQKKPTIRNPSGFVYKTAIRWSEGNAAAEEDDQYTSPQLPERTPQQEVEIQAAVTHHNLNETAQGLLRQLSYRTAMRILNDLESKGSTVRNPSAYCSTAARKARQREDRRRQKKSDENIPGQPSTAEMEVVDVVNHYEALEVEDTADEIIIKKAYRKLVLKWHPDKHPADRDEAEERIRAINEAYEVLSNPAKKGAYDQQRRAVEQRRLGKVLRSTICVKTDLPRECMLQPVGYPDKFVRYRSSTGRGGAQCFVQSRAEARREGSDITLEEFMPFFEATKLSFWWLPEVNSMCRIRAAELGTRETKGEAVRAGKAGGLNLAFRPDAHETEADSSVKLIEARKGECKENVNFIVMPSPYYEGAFRFEAAYNQGFYIAFRPPTGLRVIPYVDGMDTNCVIDFSLIDFAHMFKFIELEEVLRSAMHSVTNWMPLDLLKMDANVQAYFGNILGVPMWDDEDFQTYFAGHFDIWEYRSELRSVRLRTREERLGLELQSVATPEQMAQKIVMAGPDVLMRLPWRAVRHAFEVLNRPGSEEVSSVLARMEAKRKLIGLLGGVLATAQADKDAAAPPLVAIVGLAHQVHLISGDPGLAKTRDEAVDLLVKRVIAEINAADQSHRPLDLELADFADLLALPGMVERDAVLLRLIAMRFDTACVADLVKVVGAAHAAGIATVTKAASHVVFELLNPNNVQDTCQVITTIFKTGLLEEKCLAQLPRCAPVMGVGDLASCIAGLASKGNTSKELAEAAATLALRAPLAKKVPAEGLLNLAVAGTKTEAISPVLPAVAEAAACSLKDFSVADVIRLLLALAKAKGQPIAKEAREKLFKEAAAMLKPLLQMLSTVEIIKVGLACGDPSSSGELLQAVALEAEKRLADIQPAQLLLLTQALAPLGGQFASTQRLVDHWVEVLGCKEPEGAAVLSADQLVKLAQTLSPVVADLNGQSLQHCVALFGATILKQFDALSPQSRETVEKLFNRNDGFGLWKERSKVLRLFPQSRPCSQSPARTRNAATPPRPEAKDGECELSHNASSSARGPALERRSRSRNGMRSSDLLQGCSPPHHVEGDAVASRTWTGRSRSRSRSCSHDGAREPETRGPETEADHNGDGNASSGDQDRGKGLCSRDARPGAARDWDSGSRGTDRDKEHGHERDVDDGADGRRARSSHAPATSYDHRGRYVNADQDRAHGGRRAKAYEDDLRRDDEHGGGYDPRDPAGRSRLRPQGDRGTRDAEYRGRGGHRDQSNSRDSDYIRGYDRRREPRDDFRERSYGGGHGRHRDAGGGDGGHWRGRHEQEDYCRHDSDGRDRDYRSSGRERDYDRDYPYGRCR